MNALNFGVRGQSSRSLWNNVLEHYCTDGGIQYSMSCVELDFLVLVCNSDLQS